MKEENILSRDISLAESKERADAACKCFLQSSDS